MKLRWIFLMVTVCLFLSFSLSGCRKDTPNDSGIDELHDIPISHSDDQNKENEDEDVDKTLDGNTADHDLVLPDPVVDPDNQELIYWNVLFRDEFGTQIELQKVKNGEGAIPPTPRRVDGYRFSEWDRECNVITSNLIVTARYTPLDPDDVARLKYSEPAEDGTCSIEGIGTFVSNFLVIPEFSPDGAKVVSVANNAFYNQKLPSKITIPKTIRSVGDLAFANSNGLSVLTLEGLPAYISQTAFSGCKDLHRLVFGDAINVITASQMLWLGPLKNELFSVSLGKNVTEIESGTFEDCTHLVELKNHSPLYIVNGSSESGGIGLHLIELVQDDTDKIIEAGNFFFYRRAEDGADILFYARPECVEEGTLTLPEDVGNGIVSYELLPHVFEGWTNIEKLVVSSRVIKIGESAFYGCEGFKIVIFESSLPDMENYAFSYTSIFDLYVSNIEYTHSLDEPENNGNYWHFVHGQLVMW